MREQVGAALVSLQPEVRAEVNRVLAVRESREKQLAVSEFSLDEGYLTSSSYTSYARNASFT